MGGGGEGRERERERVRDKKKKRYEQRNERKARSLRSEKSTLGATCCDSSVGGTVNNCLHLDQCPGGVEPGASDGHTHTQKTPEKYINGAKTETHSGACVPAQIDT